MQLPWLCFRKNNILCKKFLSMEKVTLVLGASSNPERVAYQAVKSLKKRGIPLIALGRREYEDKDLKIVKEMPADIRHVHTVTLYLSPGNQKEYYNIILSLNPKRIIFNPGSQNPELARLAR